MRHILISLYSLSILFLLWILFASIISVDSVKLLTASSPESYAPAFSKNVINNFNMMVFGTVKNMMIIVSSVGLLTQIPLFYKILKKNIKNTKTKTYRSFLLYSWLGLFSPYLILLLLTSF